jgi:hypothetical protein
MKTSLHTPKDVKAYRQKLLAEQGGVDALTGLPLEEKGAVLDHNHETEVVRGVIDRQVNAALGKIENIWKRYLSTWYPGKLSDFLEQAKVYIDSDGFMQTHQVYHPNWINRCVRDFKKLDAKSQREVLTRIIEKPFDMPSNAENRARLFRSSILQERKEYLMVKLKMMMEE